MPTFRKVRKNKKTRRRYRGGANGLGANGSGQPERANGLGANGSGQPEGAKGITEEINEITDIHAKNALTKIVEILKEKSLIT